MNTFKNKHFSAIMVLPLITAALLCCCMTGEGQAQDVFYQTDTALHDCCNKAQQGQPESNQQHQKECQCHISALEIIEANSQAVFQDNAMSLQVIVSVDAFSLIPDIFSSQYFSEKILGKSPPIYIRLAHLLI